jgi:hypothetical protein
MDRARQWLHEWADEQPIKLRPPNPSSPTSSASADGPADSGTTDFRHDSG